MRINAPLDIAANASALSSELIKPSPKRKANNMNARGFTLIELMLIVAIIGILSSIALPQFAKVVRKSQEGTTLGNLACMRAAIGIYVGDHDGLYPTDDLSSLVPMYLQKLPIKQTPPYHPSGNTVSAGDATTMTTATGDWFYFNVQNTPDFGKVVVNCIHQDVKGNVWSVY